MIGGINPGNTIGFQSGNNSPVRERSDGARAPASAPEKPVESSRRDLANVRQEPVNERSPTEETLDRRVEARRAVDEVRLERFRADALSLPTARALSTFAAVASAGQESSGTGSLAGIDILV